MVGPARINPCESVSIYNSSITTKEAAVGLEKVDKTVLIPAIKACGAMLRDAITYPFIGGLDRDGTATAWMATLTVGSTILLPFFVMGIFTTTLFVPMIIASITTGWYSIPPLLRLIFAIVRPGTEYVAEKFNDYFTKYQQKMLDEEDK